MSEEKDVLNYFDKLVKSSAEELMKMYKQREEGCYAKLKTKIRFPQKRDEEYRVSEQELRFVMTSCIEKNNAIADLCYSVETPTECEYSFSDVSKNEDKDKGKEGKRSASTDLTIYSGNEKILNIEFKALQPTQGSVDKDIEKLRKECYCGAWVHILVNEDSGTIRTLFDKFKMALMTYEKLLDKGGNELPISFHVMVLKTNIILSKTMVNFDDIGDFFNIQYSDWENLSGGSKEVSGWKVNKIDL